MNANLQPSDLVIIKINDVDITIKEDHLVDVKFIEYLNSEEFDEKIIESNLMNCSFEIIFYDVDRIKILSIYDKQNNKFLRKSTFSKIVLELF